jgi:hypothetical protein
MNNTNIIYFAWINQKKNYKNIIDGQMDDLLNSGVLDNATLYIEVCCEDETLIDTIRELFSNKLKSIMFHLEIHQKNLFEYYGIKKMYDLAKEEPNKYYLYFHSKGMFNYDNIEQRHNYEKTLTKGTIYQHKKVIQLFEENPQIMTIGLFPSNKHNKNFIWLNFYWARGSYLITCQNPIISTNRFYYETWTETGDTNMSLIYNLYENNYKKYELPEVGNILNKLKGTFPL